MKDLPCARPSYDTSRNVLYVILTYISASLETHAVHKGRAHGHASAEATVTADAASPKRQFLLLCTPKPKLLAVKVCARSQDVLAAGGVIGGGKPVQGVSDGGAAGGSGGAAGLATKAASAVHAAQADASGGFQFSALVRAPPTRVAACMDLKL